MSEWKYQRVKAPDDFPGYTYKGWCLKHHLVWWKEYNEVPKDNEVIHHVNCDPTDNRISNLEKMTTSEHAKHHGKEKKRCFVNLLCPQCGDDFIKPKNKTHLSKPNQKATYCSRSCAGKISKTGYEEHPSQVLEIFYK